MKKPRGFIRHTDGGFTLIELLVVIAIIALLMAIMMPALNRVKNQARSVMCQGRLREWGLLHKLYTDDNSGYFYRGWDIGERALWMNAMRPYYKDNWDMLLCPTATREAETAADWGTFKAAYRTIATPDGGSFRYVFSYSENSWTNYMHQDRGARLKEWFWKSVTNNTSVVPGTRTVAGRPVSTNNIPVFGDNTWHDAWPLHTDEPPPYPDVAGWGNFGTTNEMWQFCINRHNGFVNLLFMDWSARHVGLKEIWTLKWHRAFETAGPYTKAGGMLPSQWPAWLRPYKDY